MIIRGKNRIFGPAEFYKGALSIAVPVMLQQLIQSMVSLVDNFMVSGLGDVSMSGVNVAGQVLFVFLIFVNTICMAGGIFMTQFYGANDVEGMQQAFRFKLVMALSAVIPYFLVCIVFPGQLLSLMLIGNTQSEAILDEAVRYIRIMFFMGPAMNCSVCMASSLRDLGRVRLPLAVTVIATFTNTLFNWLLIYGHLGFPAMGVQGAAIATVIARSLEFAIFLVAFLRLKPEFAVRLFDMPGIDRSLFGEILKKGALVLFCEMVWVLSETLTSAIYNGRGGAEVVSGMSSSFAIANLFFVAFGGIYSAAGIILGKTLGRGELERARQEKRWLLSGAAVFGVFMLMFAMSTTILIPVVFGRLSMAALHICRRMVIMMAFFTPVWVYMNAQQAIARAGGDTKMGAYTDAMITIFVMLPLLFGLGLFTRIGPVEMYFFRVNHFFYVIPWPLTRRHSTLTVA